MLLVVALASVPASSTGTDVDLEGTSSTHVRTPAEWETTETVLIRWGWEFEGYYANLTRELATVTRVVIVVSEPSDRAAIRRALRGRSTDLGNVSFRVLPTDTVWIRDYGPLTVVDPATGERSFVDSRYSVLRSDDDAFPRRYARSEGVPVVSTGRNGSDVWLDGGGFMVDGAGSLFVTASVFRTNDPRRGGDVPRRALRERLEEVFGILAVRDVTEPIRDGPRHVDMQAKLLNETTVVVAEVPPHDDDYAVLESTATYFETHRARTGEPYHVYRVPMPKGRSGAFRTYYSYTNALVVNGKVLVPTYGRSTDAEALAVYRAAMPAYEVVGVDASSIVSWGGAIHCTTIGIPAENPIPDVRVLDATTEVDGTVVVRAAASDDGRLDAVSVFYNTTADPDVVRVGMARTGEDAYEARLAGVADGEVVHFLVTARDDDGAVAYAGDRRRMRSIGVFAPTA